jgi:Na+-transporting NADH:ubiquinone oxidoreductase subunit NqrB
MRILKKGVPLFWDEVTQCSFEALKHALTSTPLLNPLDYGKYFLFYLDAVESTVDMVLVHEDGMLQENAIYYLNRGLFGPELNYNHTEKMDFAVVHAIQRFHHYILLRTTKFIVVVNPFQYVLK